MNPETETETIQRILREKKYEKDLLQKRRDLFLFSVALFLAVIALVLVG